MSAEHKDIEPIAFVMAGVLLNMHQDSRLNRTQWQALLRCTQVDESEVPLYPQSAIDTLQAQVVSLETEKAALESQLQESRLQYISDFGQCQEHMETISELRGVVEALEKQRDELMADAERYRAIKRWDGSVRDGESAPNIRLYGIQGAEENALLFTGAETEDLDAAIDAARAAIANAKGAAA